MPENLYQVTAAAAKNVEIAAVRVAPQRLLNLQRQAVHAAPHVRPADRQPHPHPARNRDHRRSKAAITAAARSGEIDAGIRSRDEPDSSISIADATAASTAAGRVASTGGSDERPRRSPPSTIGAMMTSANPRGGPISRRHR